MLLIGDVIRASGHISMIPIKRTGAPTHKIYLLAHGLIKEKMNN